MSSRNKGAKIKGEGRSSDSEPRPREDASPAGGEDYYGDPQSTAQIALLMGVGWLVPGAGHLLQRKWVRGFCFLGLVCFSVAMGAYLDGKLFSLEASRPLATLGTLASVGAGFPYLILRWLMDYEGDIRSATFEYGGAFLLTAGLMNIMALLDVWDTSRGTKP